MSKFVDGEKREWNLDLNVGLIEDVKDTTGIDLDALISEPKNMSETVFLMPRKMVEVLYVLCEKQIKERNLTPRDFAKLFSREVMDDALSAFLEVVMLFYPRSSVGSVIKQNLPRMLQTMDDKLAKDAQKNIDKVLSEIATG